MNSILRFIGTWLVVLAWVMLLLAVAIWSSTGLGPASILAVPGFILLAIGSRWKNAGGSDSSSRSSRKQRRVRSTQDISTIKFGRPKPTADQIRFAQSLGITLVDGMTKWTISDAIDDALEEERQRRL